MADRKTEYVVLDDGRSMSLDARLRSTIVQKHSVSVDGPDALISFDADEAALQNYPWRAGTYDMNMRIERGDSFVGVGLYKSSIWKFRKERDYPGCIGVFGCSMGGWFHNAKILLRYVPDGMKVFNVSFVPIDIVEAQGPWVTHKAVVSSALNGEMKCEFDVDLTAISCADFIDHVLGVLKIPAHHGYKLLHADRVFRRYVDTVASRFRIAIDAAPRKVVLLEPCGGELVPVGKKRRLESDGSSPLSVASSSSQSRSTVPIDMDAVSVSESVRAKLTKGFEACSM